MANHGSRAVHALVIAAAVLVGCRGGGEAEDDGPTVNVDTANKDWADGLSASQVEANARAMSPAEAAAAGMVVDTSIHMENLGNSDSAFVDDDAGADSIPPGPVPNPPRVPGGAAPPGQP